MTELEEQLKEKQDVVRGRLTQAKGVVKEQWGTLANDERTRLAGKKDQIVGKLQANYGDSWLRRHRNWVVFGTAVISLVAFFFIRSKSQ